MDNIYRFILAPKVENMIDRIYRILTGCKLHYRVHSDACGRKIRFFYL